ncbi:MAG TPA: hypothetical protein DDY13_11015 [Cytophagales bacterium]|jgi:hypothetical protein|nr:hypothetical protein [Cytophagales bacterium]
MKTKSRLQLIFYLLLALTVTTGTYSCKSKKKLAQEQAEAGYNRKVARAKADLESIINRTSDWTLDEQDAKIDYIKGLEINDQEVEDLIIAAERTVLEQRALAEEAEEKAEEKVDEELSSEARNLNDYFDQIAGAGSTAQSKSLINEVLGLFASPDTPVLIVIAKNGDQKDYDRPTTIQKYLNYLRDQKKSLNRVENVALDNSGKIKELELVRKSIGY